MSILTPAAPFVFDRDYANTEQVRPYYADYLAVRSVLVASGRASAQIAYNDDFRGQIPGLRDSEAKAQDTGIYLLQTLHSLEDMRAKVAAFIESGGHELTVAEVQANPTGLRGTVARYGWYSGGTGWQVYEDVRVRVTPGRFPRLAALPKGKRTHGYDLSGGGVLFRPAGVAS